MPTFQATEHKPGADDVTAYGDPRTDAPKPSKEAEPLCKLADGTAVNVYYHRHKTATVQDVIRPGYFNFMRDTFRSGGQLGVIHQIVCHLGKLEDGIKEVHLILDHAPMLYSGDVMMQKGPVFDYTPVRHDGGAVTDDDNPKGRKAA